MLNNPLRTRDVAAGTIRRQAQLLDRLKIPDLLCRLRGRLLLFRRILKHYRPLRRRRYPPMHFLQPRRLKSR